MKRLSEICKISNAIPVIGYCLMVIGVVSCTDFDDYNEAPVDSNPAGNKTLWENIQGDDRLKDFATLVNKAQFSDLLNSPRSLTIWAPATGTFNMADFENLTQEELLQQFVKGHIAEYGHPATGKVDERVHMLNSKSFLFQGEGTYTFGGHDITIANVPSTNGLIHIIDGAAKFYPNLYEYLGTAENIDMLREHFKNYELTTLDEKASVEGPMVDGKKTYIDSVMVTSNTLIRSLNAKIDNEDSTYTFIMPTDKAFQDMYDRVKPYYNFIKQVKMHDVESYTSATDTKTKLSPEINVSYMTDSLVRREIVRNLIYSNTDTYNKWLVGESEEKDTLRSTVGRKFSNPAEIAVDAMVGEPIEMSNGYARIVDSLAFYPWETFCPEMSFSPRYDMASLFPATAKVNNMVATSNGEPLTWLFGPETDITEFRYAWITPGGDRAKPDFFISMPSVMSTTYNFYVVFMPTAKMKGVHDERPNWLNFQLNYCDAKGATQTYNFSKVTAASLKPGDPMPKGPTSVSGTTAFINDPEKTDTIFIGRFTFPVNYRGLDTSYYPSLHITTPISVFNTTQLKTYSRDVCIAAILLRPVELDEFEDKNK